MSTQSIGTDNLIRLTGIAAITLGLNYVIHKMFASDKKTEHKQINTQTLIE